MSLDYSIIDSYRYRCQALPRLYEWGPPKVSITARMSCITSPERDRERKISVSWPQAVGGREVTAKPGSEDYLNG